ncbi:Tetratricopeptide domain protein [Gloeothece citriformis PCC 7424]|uniref:Tetratricopeptide domain protein n=1 Tax=Gloeothece citriformis (strain PCC 7424) TaxID=65393 RepID=B7KIS0_GLOC7|nr:tetratricopeptide repeat protein [Gloeothece citriformis]ACK70756.1 Tetratricopeptide domain protein [Gloeothece citriformis PCC 7424]
MIKYRKMPILAFLMSLLITFFIPPSHHLINLNAAQADSAQAPLFDNLGNYHHPISTDSSLAQRYFDQGLTLAYGFNHAESARSFQQATQLDPNCAMCYWGIALVQGPNINAPMADESVSQAWDALKKAIALSNQAPDPEKAYIQALAKRYTSDPLKDRSALDLDYANAMREVAQKYPDDLDAATLFADALMTTMPWNYWQENGEPKPETVELLATLESVLKRNPNHAGANHLYIHAVEKEHPELAIPAADRLQNLVPASGHLVHMPSHIYIRVGRYHDSVVANQEAIKADQDYLQYPHPESIYTAAYMPHNQHFLWFGALMTGQSKIAMEAAQNTAKVDPQQMRQPDFAGVLQHYSVIPLYTLIRFSQWDDILATPAPDRDLLYPTGVWHYSQGMAFAAKGNLKQANQQLQYLEAIAKDPALETLKIWAFNSTGDILKIASNVLAGEIAATQGNHDQAIAYLETAVNLENKLVYTEPPDWYSPTRYLLAVQLLAANRPQEAEEAFRADLKIYPENGWSLYGLQESLRAQGKTQEAQTINKRFQEAWKYADINLTAFNLDFRNS